MQARGSFWPGVRALLIAAALPLLVSLGCRPAPPAQDAPSEPPAPLLPAAPPGRVALLALTGHLDGYLEPCHCVEGMLGGLPRRANLFRSIEDESGVPVLPVEGGDLVNGYGEQAQLKLETTFEVLAALGYTVVVPGEQDLRHGVRRLQDLATRRGMTLVAANLADAQGNHPFAASATVSRGGVAVRVVGLVSREVAPEVEATAHLAVLDPAEALAGVLGTATDAGPPVVLVLHGPAEEALALLAAEPRLAAALAAHAGDTARVLYTADGRPVVASGTRGIHVLVADLLADGTARETHDIPVSDRIPDHPDIIGMIQAYRDRVAEHGFAEDDRARPAATGGSYTGSRACQMCHRSAYEAWEGSAHTHAFEPLAPRHAQGDPECLICHVTGLRYAGGFRSVEATPHLATVGCEACHGPGSNHAEHPQAESGYGRMERPAGCIECHDPENSPAFDFETYWPRIVHGR